MPNYPSGGEYFGTGFLQGLGTSLGALPQIIDVMQQRELQKEELSLKKKRMDMEDKLLEIKIQKATRKGGGLEQALMSLQKFGLLQGGGGGGEGGAAGISGLTAAPAPGNSGTLAGLGPAQGASPDASALGQAPTDLGQPQEISQGGGGAAPPPQGAEMQLRGISIDPEDGSFKMQLGPREWKVDYQARETSPGQYNVVGVFTDPTRPGAMFEKVIPGRPVPPAEIQAAVKAAEGLGASPGGGADHIASMILAAKVLGPDSLPAAMKQIQAEARQLGAGASPAGGLDVEKAVGEGIDTSIKKTAGEAGARTQAAQAPMRRQVAGLMSALQKTFKGIKLPKTGGGRVSDSPRLLGESLTQSNKSLVLFNTLKEGFLATIARAAGERGTLTDQDAARARALFPNVVPSFAALPDTQAVGQAKLQQLNDLLVDFIHRDPELAEDLKSLADSSDDEGAAGFTIDSMTPVQP